MKIVSHSNNSNAGISGKIANMMLGQYKKGLSIKNNELAIESGETSTPDVINPSQTLRVPMAKGKIQHKGYSVKDTKKYTSTNNVLTVGSSVKEFIKQSRILDNELDQMLAMLKLNNKDEFYKGKPYEEGAGMMTGGGIQRNLWSNKTPKDINKKIKDLIKELQKHDVSSKKGMELQDDIEYLQSLLEAISQPSSAMEEKSEAEPPAINVEQWEDKSPTPSEASPMPFASDYEKLSVEDKEAYKTWSTEQLMVDLKNTEKHLKKLQKKGLDTTDIQEDIEFIKSLIEEKNDIIN
jgi:hypothetical protein